MPKPLTEAQKARKNELRRQRHAANPEAHREAARRRYAASLVVRKAKQIEQRAKMLVGCGKQTAHEIMDWHQARQARDQGKPFEQFKPWWVP
jgi:hypothetical protein